MKLSKRTNFSFEVPIKHLRDFDLHQDFIFALSFLMENTQYRSYIKKCIEGGAEVVIDNSYNELHTPESAEKMVTLYNKFNIHPTLNNLAVVCPDSHDWNKIKLFMEYFKMVEKMPLSNIMLIYKNPEQWNIMEAFHLPKFVRAVPYDCRKNFPDSWEFDRYSHFLGLLSPWEIIKHRPISCDTSMPIKLALQGMNIPQWIEAGCPHLQTHPDFFAYKLSTKQIDLAVNNIVNLKEFIRMGLPLWEDGDEEGEDS